METVNWAMTFFAKYRKAVIAAFAALVLINQLRPDGMTTDEWWIAANAVLGVVGVWLFPNSVPPVIENEPAGDTGRTRPDGW